MALELAPILVETVTALHLSAAVAYRAAGIYAKGHAAGVVPGGSHERTLAAAIRIASIEAGTPCPLLDIADAVNETPKAVRNKFHRLMEETNITETLAPTDLIVQPVDYVPYMARKLELADNDQLCNRVEELLNDAELDGGSNPMSEVAAAFYIAMKKSPKSSITQRQIADVAGLSEVTIRNNYRKFQH